MTAISCMPISKITITFFIKKLFPTVFNIKPSLFYALVIKTQTQKSLDNIYLFIWVQTSLSTLYKSYHDGKFYGQRKPVHTVGRDSVL